MIGFFVGVLPGAGATLSSFLAYATEKRVSRRSEQFGTAKGYEFYKNVGAYIERHGPDGAARDFVKLMPWGTPEQVIEKLRFIRETIHMTGIMGHFSFAGMPYDEAERNLRCFVERVMPELKRWDAEPAAAARGVAAGS